MFEAIPIPGGPTGTSEVAAALGIDPVPEPARFVAEITRLTYDVPEGRSSGADARIERVKTLLASLRAVPPDDNVRVPVPLTTAVWTKAIFHRAIAPADLFGAIISDRQAALLCHGLTALDDETLQFFAEHPALLMRLYERSAAAFAAFAAAVHVHDGRVVPPGGDAAVPLWEAAAGARVDQPDRFLPEIFEQADGRLAYLYETIAQAEPAKAAFALGLWMADAGARASRFKALVAATSGSYRDWHVRAFPFTRPLNDTSVLLVRINTDPQGRPALASRAMWLHAFGLHGDDAADAAAPVDAAWLAEAILAHDLQVRADRLDQLGFGHRVFLSDTDDAREALRAFPQCRMLMLTLERMGITAPATYAAAARDAARLTAISPGRASVPLTEFQGAIALLARMVRVQSLAGDRAAALLDRLLACQPGADDRYDGAIARWIDEDLRPALAPADDVESAILEAIAGRRTQGPVVTWEGQRYRVDPAAGEVRRLRRVREKQGGFTVDLALALHASAATLSSAPANRDHVDSAIERLKAIEPELAARPSQPTGAPLAIEPDRISRDRLSRAVKDLGRRPGAGNVAAVAGAVADVGDAVLADTLLSLVYALYVGDPDGPVLLGGDVALRHDFGLSLRDVGARARLAWGMPKIDVIPGTPWRVRGSLLGLDAGLSSLALRRMNSDRMIAAPVLTSNEREGFATSVALLNPFSLADTDRDAIAAALKRGRARVAALTPAEFETDAEQTGMDAHRRYTARRLFQMGETGPANAQLLSLFSAAELLRLGNGDVSALPEWGMSAYGWLGCICLRLTAPTSWTMWTGRPQLGVLSSLVADLNLRIAEELSDLHLPAPLARHVLAFAMQDFVDEARPTDSNDWLALVRAAQQVSRERVEDYVAAAAAADGPLVPEGARP